MAQTFVNQKQQVANATFIPAKQLFSILTNDFQAIINEKQYSQTDKNTFKYNVSLLSL